MMISTAAQCSGKFNPDRFLNYLGD